MKKPLKRFTDRIWKTIYRDPVDCWCATCEDGGKHWVEIFSDSHAKYLHAVHYDMDIEYYDTQDDQLEKLKTMFWM